MYNPFLVYCRELAPGTVSLTGDRAQGDDSKHDSHYNESCLLKPYPFLLANIVDPDEMLQNAAFHQGLH